jgi:hypothetical protein
VRSAEAQAAGCSGLCCGVSHTRSPSQNQYWGMKTALFSEGSAYQLTEFKRFVM